MARIRSIKPEFWSSPGIEQVDPWARLLFIAMWNWADDSGVGVANPRELLGFAFPLDEDITVAELRRMLVEIRRVFGVDFYTVAGRQYYSIPSWEKHQKFDRRSKGKYPGPEEADTPSDQGKSEPSTESHESPSNPRRDSVAGTGEQGNRGTGEQSSSSEVATATIRPDVLSLITLLDSEIVANGGKPPTRTKKNLDAARLMLDRDGRTYEQVEAAIRWSQSNEFWRTNILSMSKLREKYEQLRLAAQRTQKPRHLTAVEENLLNFEQRYGASNG